MKINKLITGLLLALTPLFAQAEQANDIVGVWLTQDKDGYIEVFEQNSKYFGRAIGNPENEFRNDTENPDDALRGRSLKDAIIMQDLEFDGDDTWKGGTIYDPNTGKTYKCKITLDGPELLKLRGYIGSPILGRTNEWTLLTNDVSKFNARTGEVIP